MDFRCRLCIFRLVAVAVLALGQTVHVVEHLAEASPLTAHHHGHSHESPPANDNSGESHQPAEHSHSPAVLTADVRHGFLAITLAASAAEFFVPEAPVSKIEYPPQLS